MWKKKYLHTSRWEWISSCCVFFFFLCSDKDPSGLLLLPPKRAPSDYEVAPILSVMETLLLVATREVRGLESCTSQSRKTRFYLHAWCSSLLNCLCSLSVRSWWWMGAIEPAGPCCCPCSGLCRAACSLGATCNSKADPPLLSIWTWRETF